MSEKFNTISIILMVILVGLLFYVMINYYTKPDMVSSEAPLHMIETDVLVSSGDSEAIVSNYVQDDKSGETPIISNSGNKEDELPGDGVIDVIYNQEGTPKPDEKLIITSDENISDKEKKEVLHQLDQTLMDLLDVVDKVQIVDESRLGEESEVQP